MKNFRYFAAAILITWVTSSDAFIPHVDLKDATAVAEGQCEHENRTYKCFILAKDTEFFIVAVDFVGNNKSCTVRFECLTAKSLRNGGFVLLYYK